MPRFGVVGVGRRGMDHIEALREVEEASVKAACDVDERRLYEVSRRYGVRTYTSLDEMLLKENLDAVSICSPTPLHVEQAFRCLEAEVDIMLEKPVALKISDARMLSKAIERRDKIVAVGFQSRYSEIVKKGMEHIDQETLSMVAGFFYWTVPIVRWIRLRTKGGGQIVDQAIHLLDLYRYLAGEVETLHAAYTERGRDSATDRAEGFDNWASYVVALRFKSGAVGTLYSTYALYPGVLSSGANIDYVCRELLVRYVHGRETRIYRKGEKIKVFKQLGNPTLEMYRRFVEAVKKRDRTAILTPYRDSYKTIALALAANKSAKTGEPVNVDRFTAED